MLLILVDAVNIGDTKVLLMIFGELKDFHFVCLGSGVFW
jgi:hypothetical protein